MDDVLPDEPDDEPDDDVEEPDVPEEVDEPDVEPFADSVDDPFVAPASLPDDFSAGVVLPEPFVDARESVL